MKCINSRESFSTHTHTLSHTTHTHTHIISQQRAQKEYAQRPERPEARPEKPAAYHRQQALQEGGETKSVNLADAVVGPAPTGNAGSDYKKRGSMAVSKVDANGYYYLNVAGEVGHEIRAILQVIRVYPCTHGVMNVYP